MVLLFSNAYSQGKKIMNSSVYKEWNRISDEKISSDGKWVLYTLSTEEGDDRTVLYNTITGIEKRFSRLTNVLLSNDGKLLTAMITPSKEHVKDLRRKKTKKEDLPKDSLFVYLPELAREYKFSKVSDVKKSKYYSDFVAFKMETPDYKKDTLMAKVDIKKQSKDNGNHLILFNALANTFDTIKYVKEFEIALKSPAVFAHTAGPDSLNNFQLIKFNQTNKEKLVISTIKLVDIKMHSNEVGDRLIGIVCQDTTKNQILDRSVYYWAQSAGDFKELVSSSHPVIPSGWYIPDFTPVSFSKNSSTIYLGFAPKPILADTSALDEELVQVEVWSYKDPVLYTTQEVRINQDRKKTYTFAIDTDENQLMQITKEGMEDLIRNKNGSPNALLVQDRITYGIEATWKGGALSNVYKYDMGTGNHTIIATKKDISPRISPSGKFATWFDSDSLLWKIYTFENNLVKTLISDEKIVFADELNDVPDQPSSYGLAGWTKNDEEVLIYDRYDIWAINQKNNTKKKLTNGRQNKMVYRYIHLDEENEEILLNQPILLRLFDEQTKESGYGSFDKATNKVTVLEKGPFSYSNRVMKATNSTEIITKRENFTVFPDIVLSDLKMASFKKISNANPQQSEYNWGNIELFKWTNEAGEKLEGLLVKPEGFDPKKKYPLIVNFYERSADGLYTHKAPYAGRSTISYSYYASKGYLIFNPDITYRLGYPGESCYEDLMTGVTALTKLGFVDTTKMGLQGHSWGGYQVSYLLNKTNKFACAESGAPVVNMTSAYGGIRWESGMSRMFQYEKTQSRIGKTLWEAPELYISNSPLFELPKSNTPVLIMHNDNDGAVPWYQGIEYYMALRRLGKPAWLLNYNGEPHWPVKWQNRLDFNIRMEQFFDHYLMGKSLPSWMKNGVPAINKGVVTGYEGYIK
jgi:dienelactone hydrolase